MLVSKAPARIKAGPSVDRVCVCVCVKRVCVCVKRPGALLKISQAGKRRGSGESIQTFDWYAHARVSMHAVVIINRHHSIISQQMINRSIDHSSIINNNNNNK